MSRFSTNRSVKAYRPANTAFPGPASRNDATPLRKSSVSTTSAATSFMASSAPGTPLEAVWYCPTCDAPVQLADAGEDLHFA